MLITLNNTVVERIKKINPIIKILAGFFLIAFVLLSLLLIIGHREVHKFTGLSPKSLEELRKEIKETEKEFPIAKDLPYGGPFVSKPFFIHSPTKDGTILVEVDKEKDEETVKKEVYDWVRYHGYNPADYNFTFKTTEFPKK